jgi:hypothetical protein
VKEDRWLLKVISTVEEEIDHRREKKKLTRSSVKSEQKWIS